MKEKRRLEICINAETTEMGTGDFNAIPLQSKDRKLTRCQVGSAEAGRRCAKQSTILRQKRSAPFRSVTVPLSLYCTLMAFRSLRSLYIIVSSIVPHLA
ncbi:hypothetical protein LSTR_LSTR006893 [Laodelphax striatellus]|uniref:Uncharacterized protein n=1 Tax=Laodelphax striatellus TaxID=195883 RepID=A0A482WKC3_LAOST|nr:hypothetical protein LSTR_LSTR006893 [Laodelphax striatellus]